MHRFREGKIAVLVATTVIEVGIDVANATVMAVDHPERFGLAQLHQLRGRVGRGTGDSYCILLAGDRVSDRLKKFAATEDGFQIAELDLEERQMGDLLGQRQAGEFELRHARLPADTALLERARSLARRMLDQDPLLERREHQPLRQRALARYPRAMELFRTG